MLTALCEQLRDAAGLKVPTAFWQEGMRSYLPQHEQKHPDSTTQTDPDTAMDKHPEPVRPAAAGAAPNESTQQQDEQDEVRVLQELYDRQGYWGLPAPLRLRMLCALCHDLLHTPLLR